MFPENEAHSPDATPGQAPETTPKTTPESPSQASPGTEPFATATEERHSSATTEQPLEDTLQGSAPLDIEFLLDIPLQVKVEVGRTRMQINDLLQLSQGSVIELQKLVGEPFEVLVNEKLVARGEVVVVNERFGARLTDIITPMERIKQLG
jgi:flagellar motor switch protein FliN/FliY